MARRSSTTGGRITPSEARAQVLAQHARLRGLLGASLAIARRHLRGTALDRDVDEIVERIRGALSEHNRLEEELLTPILRANPAWGARRIERMVREHQAEHRVLETHLTRPPHELVLELAELVEQINEHMAAEERTFLAAETLDEP